MKSYTEAIHGVGWFIRKSFLLTLLSFYPQPSSVKLHLADMRTCDLCAVSCVDIKVAQELTRHAHNP